MKESKFLRHFVYLVFKINHKKNSCIDKILCCKKNLIGRHRIISSMKKKINDYIKKHMINAIFAVSFEYMISRRWKK